MKLEQLSVAMVEPRYGLNIGYVARTMKNFGAHRLFIVGKNGVPSSAIRFASHAADVIRDAQHVNFGDLRKRFDFVAGTTAIKAGSGQNPVRKIITLDQMTALGVDPASTVILLGRDTTGMTNAELNICDLIVHVPTGTSYPTLNISHALAIMLYSLSVSKSKIVRPVERIYVDESLACFSTMLSLSKYPVHKRRRAVRIFGTAMVRSQAREEEVVTLLGVFRKVNLALERRF